MVPSPPEVIQWFGCSNLSVLGSPHLVLPDLGGDEDVLFYRARQLVQPLDCVLRLDDRAGLHVPGEFQAVLGALCIDLPPPRRQRLTVHRRGDPACHAASKAPPERARRRR